MPNERSEPPRLDLPQEDDAVLPLAHRRRAVAARRGCRRRGRRARGSAWRTASWRRCVVVRGARPPPRRCESPSKVRCRGRSRPGPPGSARVAWWRMLAVSAISTMKVDWPRARSSLAPTRVKMRSTRPIRASRAGHEAARSAPCSTIERDLAQEGAILPRHVRPGDDHQPAAPSRRARGRWGRSGSRGSALDDRVAALAIDELVAVVDVAAGRSRSGRRPRPARPARRARPARAPALERRAAAATTRARSSSKSSQLAARTIARRRASTLSSYSFSSGVMKRSPPAIVCLRDVVGRHQLPGSRLADLDVVAEDLVEARP